MRNVDYEHVRTSFAGRSPKDKRVIREPDTEKDVWWGQGVYA